MSSLAASNQCPLVSRLAADGSQTHQRMHAQGQQRPAAGPWRPRGPRHGAPGAVSALKAAASVPKQCSGRAGLAWIMMDGCMAFQMSEGCGTLRLARRVHRSNTSTRPYQLLPGLPGHRFRPGVQPSNTLAAHLHHLELPRTTAAARPSCSRWSRTAARCTLPIMPLPASHVCRIIWTRCHPPPVPAPVPVLPHARHTA